MKNHVYCIVSLRDKEIILDTSKPFSWTNDGVKILGVDIIANKNNMLNYNYIGVVDKIKLILKQWKSHN